MEEGDRSRVIRFEEAQGQIPGPPGQHFVSLMQRGSLRVVLSLPVSPNRQSPHAQDEIYVIVRGRGSLFHGGKRDPFGAGDLLFVSAGTEHWFEDFSDDLAVWVIFYGPNGGEVPV
jgi:mannose-6-phosphate isomerase-like protein (cupin superfamily)